MQKISPNLNVMLKAIRKASRAVARDFGEVENLQVSKKGPGDFVTASDLKAEKIIFEELQKARPKYGFLLEESGDIKGEDDSFTWIVDPIDGTSNFIHSIADFCITIALEKRTGDNSEIIAAVTLNPISKEIFMAEKGQGVWYESADSSHTRRLRVSERRKSFDSIIALGSLKDDTFKYIDPTEFCGVRCLGSTALGLAYVAAGKYDAFIQKNVKKWDMAAGVLFIQEAGGYIGDFKGGKNFFEKEEIIAANEHLFNMLESKISKM